MKKKLMNKAVSLCSAAALAGSAVWSPVFVASADGSGVYINEVCTGNTGANGNIDGEYDWIELYNANDSDVDISGWKLIKDDSSEYVFGSVVLPANSSTVVVCAKKYAGDDSIPHAGYNLSGSGVKLTLTDGENSVDELEVPALADDTVWARQPDGSDSLGMFLPTPGYSNNEAESAIPCNAPELSAESGMYDASFDLTMQTDEGNTIYYTTDGTDPATSSTRIEYSQPINIYNRSSSPMTIANYVSPSKVTPWASSNSYAIPKNSAVDKGTVVRAVTLSSAGEYSETVTKTYFVGVSSQDHNDLPILSVTTDPANLFDYNTGIYVLGKVYDDNKATAPDKNNPPANYNQKGKEWERACHIDFFEPDGTLAVSQDCGMRTQGAYSRADYQKSFRFYAREEYGEKNFKYEFFDNAYQENGSGKKLKKFKKLVVRNGGNDTNYAKFKDSYIQSLFADRQFDTQEGRPCVVYIDGEYWGLYTLQEDFDDHYFEENYDVNADEVVVYKKGEIDEGNEEDIQLFRDLRTFAKNNNLALASNYNKISQMLDLQSFADYCAAEMYIINEDWPGNNYSMWRTRTVDETNPYSDGRWRMNFYDTEMGVDHYGNSSTKYNVDNLKKIMQNSWDDVPVLFNALIKNANFKQMFINAMMDYANINCKPSTALAAEKDFINAYRPELYKYFSRFPSWANVGNAADPCISRMETFIKNRPGYVPTMLKNNLGLNTAVAVNVSAVNPEGGSVYVNTSTIDVSNGLTGKYFPGVKITLTAAAKEGYAFAGWAGTVDSDSASITIDPADASYVQAVFIKEGESVHKVRFYYGTKSVTTKVADGAAAEFPAEYFEREGFSASVNEDLSNITSDLDCQVVYKGATYKVKFNASGATGSMPMQSFTYGKAQSLYANTFKKSGYAFKGWATVNGSLLVKYNDKQTVLNLASKDGTTYNLYAVWGKDIADCNISLSASSFVYNGSVQKPTVTVKNGSTILKEGSAYTVSIGSNKNCGTYKVTVTGTGSYAGTKTVYYKIVPAALKFKLLTRTTSSMKIDWNASAGADSYKVYREENGTFKLLATTKALTYTDKDVKAGTVYKYRITPYGGSVAGGSFTFTNCTKSAVPTLKASSGAATKVTFKWNKITPCSGYQIVYCNQKNGTYKALRHLGKATTSYTHSGIRSGSTWYFKIRCYTEINGKKYFSDYSAPVMVKVK